MRVPALRIRSVLAAVLCAGASLAAQDPAPAALLLERAEQAAAKGNYTEARSLYRKLAKDFLGTPEGATGVRRSKPSAYLGWTELLHNGPSAQRIDVVVIGDGFTLQNQKSFDELAKGVPARMLRSEVFEEYASAFNWIKANTCSADDGVDGFGREYDTALGAYVAGDVQGQINVNHDAVRLMLDELPTHDGLVLACVKQAVLGMGGGGVATVAGRDDRLLLHEWGHAFAALGDEYTTNTGHSRQSSAPNLSSSEDPELAPWKHFLEARVPGVGLYQGANGQERGVWKPVASGCTMENGERYCPVCREALVLEILRRVDLIDSALPLPSAREAQDSLRFEANPGGTGILPLRFEVRTLPLATHSIEVDWWLVPELNAPAEPEPRASQLRGLGGQQDGVRQAPLDRASRGLLPRLMGKPLDTTKGGSQGRHAFELKPERLVPGRYRLLARARDDAQPRGERFPWVLADPQGLLEAQRGWWILVE